MKVSLTIATVVLAFATGAFGQAGQSQPQSTPPSGGTSQHSMHRHGPMHHHPEMVKKHMEEMQAHMKDMTSRVEKLRTDAQNVQDPATRTALLDAADLWEQMVSHMQMHMQHMEHMMGPEKMGHGRMDHGGMHCKMMDHGGMHHDMGGEHEGMHHDMGGEHEGMHHMDSMGEDHEDQHHPSDKDEGSEAKPQ